MSQELLVYSQKTTSRIRYVFKHIWARVLGLPVSFTNEIEAFVAHEGPKLSYTTKQLGNELHLGCVELLFEQGVSDTTIQVSDWEGIPCFFSIKNQDSVLPYDIFAASFYLLSRYEEYLPHVKDVEGRFPFSESLAAQNDFLQLPLVDEWIARLRKVFEERYPEVLLREPSFEIDISIMVPQAFAYKKIGFIRTVGGYLQDFVKLRLRQVFNRTSVILGVRKDPYDIFTWLVNIQKQSRYKFNVLFELGDQTGDTINVRYSKTSFRSLIKMVGDYCEVGLLASVVSSYDSNVLKKEKSRLEAIVNRPLQIAKFSNNQYTIPHSYRKLLEEEVIRDSSMGYPKEIGFRAGTCRPFLFYDLDYEMQTPLLLIPVCLPLEAGVSAGVNTVNLVEINRIKERVEKVQGMLGISCTNSVLAMSRWRSVFKQIIGVS